MPTPISINPVIQERRDEVIVLQAEATPNNQYLVWDRLADNWVGTWEGAALRASQLFNFHQGDALRGAAVHPDGSVRQLLVDHTTDDDGAHEGMVFEAAMDVGDQEGRGIWLNLEMEHHHGAWAAFAEADGEGERQGPLQVVPDAAACAAFDSPEYDLTNADDDQMKPYREDYATLWTDDGVYISASKGLVFGARQRWVQKVRFRKRLRSLTVRVETMRGWVAIRRVSERVKAVAFGRGRKV